MKSGQTLVLLMVFMAIAITVITASILLTISVSQSASRQETGSAVLQLAESGIEDALMQILRNPATTGTYSLPLDDQTATISISGADPYVVRSTAQIGNLIRIVQAQASFLDGRLSVSSWQEIYP